MKLHCLITMMFLWVVFSLSVSAQQNKQTLPATTSQPSSSFELINLTGDSIVLGYLKISPGDNDREAIVSPVDKQRWLQNTVALEAGKVAAKSGKVVLYILHNISVGRTSEGNYVRVKAAVYAGRDTKYNMWKRIDTLVTDKAKDINSVGKLVAAAVASSLTGQDGLPAHSPGLPSGPAPSLTRDEAIRTETQRFAFIRCSSNPTGIYMSYEEFKAGKPKFEHFYLKGEDESSRLTVYSFTEADSTMRPR